MHSNHLKIWLQLSSYQYFTLTIMTKIDNTIFKAKIFQDLFLYFVIFSALVAWGIFNHAMWRDELNGWLIARDTQSWAEFFNAVKYEGHPLLWYIALALLNKLSHDPILMKIFHLFLSVTSIYLFLKYAPFKKLERVLFIFGYLPIYEYSLISRNYMIGILFLLIFLVIYSSRKNDYGSQMLILAILANTNAYCLLISLALAIFVILESKQKQQAFKSLMLYLVGLAISLYTLLPPSDSRLQGGASQWFWHFDGYRLAQSITRIWNAYVMILVPGDGKIWDVTGFSLLSLGLLAFTIKILYKKPYVLFFYIFASWEILLFTYLKFLGSPRHYGMLYIILISSLWLAQSGKRFDYKPIRYQRSFILAILIAQVLAGLVAYVRDLSLPFSASRETAHYIKEHKLENSTLVGSEDFAVSPISGYLGKKIYYPEIKGYGSYVLFNGNRKEVNDLEILQQIKNLIKTKQDNILLILNHAMAPNTTQKDIQIEPIEKFTNSLISNEQYYLYSIKNEKNNQ